MIIVYTFRNKVAVCTHTHTISTEEYVWMYGVRYARLTHTMQSIHSNVTLLRIYRIHNSSNNNNNTI